MTIKQLFVRAVIVLALIYAALSFFAHTQKEWDWVKQNPDCFPENEVTYAQGNKELIHFMYAYGMDEYETGHPISYTSQEKNEAIPTLYQWDERWGFDTYGSSVIGFTGCAPTSLAMVLTGLTGNYDINPRDIASYAQKNGYYVSGFGTKWDVMPAVAARYGVTCTSLSIDEARIRSELEAGHPLICNMGPGHFTNNGHFIVIYGEKENMLLIHDPNSVKNSKKEWAYADISSEIRAVWSFGG